MQESQYVHSTCTHTLAPFQLIASFLEDAPSRASDVCKKVAKLRKCAINAIIRQRRPFASLVRAGRTGGLQSSSRPRSRGGCRRSRGHTVHLLPDGDQRLCLRLQPCVLHARRHRAAFRGGPPLSRPTRHDAWRHARLHGHHPAPLAGCGVPLRPLTVSLWSEATAHGAGWRRRMRRQRRDARHARAATAIHVHRGADNSHLRPEHQVCARSKLCPLAAHLPDARALPRTDLCTARATDAATRAGRRSCPI